MTELHADTIEFLMDAASKTTGKQPHVGPSRPPQVLVERSDGLDGAGGRQGTLSLVLAGAVLPCGTIDGIAVLAVCCALQRGAHPHPRIYTRMLHQYAVRSSTSTRCPRYPARGVGGDSGLQ